MSTATRTTCSPSFEEFCSLADRARVVPVVRRVCADWITPVAAYALVGKAPGSYLLESVLGGEKWGRYSFVGFGADVIVRAAGNHVQEWNHQGVRMYPVDDPWQDLRERLAVYQPAHQREDLPRFWGGAVGYVPYEAVRGFEPTVAAGSAGGSVDLTEVHHYTFAIGGTVLVFDNLKQQLSVVVPVLVPPQADHRSLYDKAVEQVEQTLAALHQPSPLEELDVGALWLDQPPVHSALGELRSSFTKPAFEDAVRRAQQYIHEGDIFQLVLSQQFEVAAPSVDALDVYRALRMINPSPYMYFLRFPEVRIAGASPETLVRMEQGVAEVRPIAGTLPRGRTHDEDVLLERKLLDDPKERAEHVMLVDLGRNDLGRVSEPGSVQVTDQLLVEKYSHVMHIVSNVQGRVAAGIDALAVLRSTFPAGTLSGAPKVRAMQIIDELEPVPRGVYGGAVGYIGLDGNMDFAISIRTVTEQEGVFRIQAGAGIVEASVPAREYEETLNKSKAPRLALSVAMANAKQPDEPSF
jgi:anthranilate synthase component 1